MAFLEEYTLLDELGQGSFATVYKVRHNSLGYIRAIRVLNATIAHGESDNTYKRFLEECKILLRLGNGNHPNIVHVYQPLLRAQKAIVEMDFVNGKDIYHYLEDRSFFVDIQDVLNLLTDIGSALAYCHEDIYKFCMDKDEDNLKDDPNDGSKILLDAETRTRLIKKYRVIHNDIHSGNIIRREDGRFVLLDFGLAVEGDNVVRSSRRKNGAPEFKAPEKWDNEGLLTTSSDIYSFGVVLYEFLSGRVPFLFDKQNPNSVEAEYLLGKAHKEAQPESVYELRKTAFERSHPGETYKKDYPEWLETLIMKCLAKAPKDRFRNGKELFIFAQNNLTKEKDLLEQENEKLRRTIEQVNISRIKTDELILNLQMQLKNSGGEISALKDQNHSLTEQLSQCQELHHEQSQKIEDLENQLNRSDIQSNPVSSKEQSPECSQNEIPREKDQKEERNGHLKTNKLSKSTIGIILVLILAVSGFWIVNANRSNKINSDQTVAEPTADGNRNCYTDSIDSRSAQEMMEECDKLRKEIDSLHNSNPNGAGNKRLIDSLEDQIKEKNIQIDQLHSEIKTLSAENSGFKSAKAVGRENQKAVAERDKTISQLRNQIKSLKNQITKKNEEIKALQKQLFN